PRQARHGFLRVLEADGEEAAPGIRQYRRAQLLFVDVVQRPLHAQRAQRPPLGSDPTVEQRDHRQHDERHRQGPREDAQQGVHLRPPPSRSSEVSSTRQHNSSNSMPSWRAALGTSEWLVMPGAVFTSSRWNLPVARSRITSTRAQPLQSTALNAATARRRISSSASPSRPGHRYCVSSATYLAW